MQAQYGNVLIFEMTIKTIKLQSLYAAMDCKTTSLSAEDAIMKSMTPESDKCTKTKSANDYKSKKPSVKKNNVWSKLKRQTKPDVVLHGTSMTTIEYHKQSITKKLTMKSAIEGHDKSAKKNKLTMRNIKNCEEWHAYHGSNIKPILRTVKNLILLNDMSTANTATIMMMNNAMPSSSSQ